MQKTLFPGYTIGTDAYDDIANVCPAFGKKIKRLGIAGNIFCIYLALNTCYLYGRKGISRLRHQPCLHTVGISGKQHFGARIFLAERIGNRKRGIYMSRSTAASKQNFHTLPSVPTAANSAAAYQFFSIEAILDMARIIPISPISITRLVPPYEKKGRLIPVLGSVLVTTAMLSSV